MARSKEYFIKVLTGYKTDMIMTTNDIDEVMQVICDKHIKMGCMLGKDDMVLLRECIRECMVKNTSKNKNGSTITTATKVIESIDPTAIVSDPSELITEVKARINSSLLTPENIGRIAPLVACKTLCDIYEKERLAIGSPIQEDQKFNPDRFAKSFIGKSLSFIGERIAYHSSNNKNSAE